MSDFGRWKCLECGHKFYTWQFFTATSPFDENDTLSACPECKTVQRAEELCEEHGCELTASCGTPFGAGGYKRHCHLHPPTKFQDK